MHNLLVRQPATLGALHNIVSLPMVVTPRASLTQSLHAHRHSDVTSFLPLSHLHAQIRKVLLTGCDYLGPQLGSACSHFGCLQVLAHKPLPPRPLSLLELVLSPKHVAVGRGVVAAVSDVRVRVRSARLQTPATEAAPAAVAGQREAAVEVEECGAALRAFKCQQRVDDVSPGMVDLRQQQRRQQQQQHPNKRSSSGAR